MKKLTIILILISLVIPSVVFGATTNLSQTITKPVVRIFNPVTGELISQFFPFTNDSLALGANVASADLNHDGVAEIIVASGNNSKPYIKIFNSTGILQREFLAYDEIYEGGIKAVTADINNDQTPEIITAQNETGHTLIKIFDSLGNQILQFYNIDKNTIGGASIAAGDINQDGQIEIIVGAGYDQEPSVKIYDNYGHYLTEFLAFDKKFAGGVNVAAADILNQGYSQIIVSPANDAAPEVKIFDPNGILIKTFYAYHPGFSGGVNLSIGDINNDNRIEIITGAGFSGGAHARIYNANGNYLLNPKFFAFENFKGGISVATGDINHDGQVEIIVATQTISLENNYQSFKSINIDLTKQKLYAYFKGQKANEFIISSGKNGFPTPKGTFKIYNRVDSQTMARNYGRNNPNNYYLPNVPNVQYFFKGFAIHGAYWH